MLVETKAKVGVFAIALGAYLPQFPTLVPEFEAQYDVFKKTIPDTVEMIDGGIVTTKELSMEAGDKFRAADVDLVILQLLTYATSYNMLPAVRDLNVPVVLVNVQKRKAPDYANTDTPKWLGELYACGAVGEMVADLERAGKRCFTSRQGSFSSSWRICAFATRRRKSPSIGTVKFWMRIC